MTAPSVKFGIASNISSDLDKNAVNVIQRALEISQENQREGFVNIPEDEMEKNLLSIDKSPLIMNPFAAVCIHFLPGVIGLVGFNFFLKLFPFLHVLVVFNLSLLIFVIPFEIVCCLWISKRLYQKWIPNHLSQIFMFFPPHLNDLEMQNPSNSGVIFRIISLFKELYSLLKIFNLKTLFLYFSWAVVSYVLISPYETRLYVNHVAPAIVSYFDTPPAYPIASKIHKVFAKAFFAVDIYPAVMGHAPTDIGLFGFVIILLGLVVSPLFEEFYYRGICLVSLVQSRWYKEKALKSDVKKDENKHEESRNTGSKGKKAARLTPAERMAYVKEISRTFTFIRRNAWLVNCVCASLSTALLNPWMVLSHIFALFPIVYLVQREANLILLLQIQWLLAVAQLTQFVTILLFSKK